MAAALQTDDGRIDRMARRRPAPAVLPGRVVGSRPMFVPTAPEITP